jgi:hypothetical protein
LWRYARGVEAKRVDVAGSKMKYYTAAKLITKRVGKVKVERKRAQKAPSIWIDKDIPILQQMVRWKAASSSQTVMRLL